MFTRSWQRGCRTAKLGLAGNDGYCCSLPLGHMPAGQPLLRLVLLKKAVIQLV